MCVIERNYFIFFTLLKHAIVYFCKLEYLKVTRHFFTGLVSIELSLKDEYRIRLIPIASGFYPSGYGIYNV